MSKLELMQPVFERFKRYRFLMGVRIARLLLFYCPSTNNEESSFQCHNVWFDSRNLVFSHSNSMTAFFFMIISE